MNRKVVSSMLSLCVAYIACCYILKFFFPQEFVLAVSNPRLIAIGNFIDSHKAVDFTCGCFTSFATYWLYTCAVCGRKNLKWWQNIILFSMYPLSEAFMLVSVETTSYFSIFAMLLIPAFVGAELKRTSIIFTFHGVCQLLSISVRGISSRLLSYDFATLFVVGLECYFWLILFYLRFNFYKNDKENENGQQNSPLLRKKQIL
jgi:hypothetical protein